MKKLKWLVAFLLVLVCAVFAGCWDSNELDELFIVTGIGVDAAPNNQIELTMQVGSTQSSGGSSTSGGGSGGSVQPITISMIGDTVISMIGKINRNSSRTLLLDHNQIVVFSKELAERGIKDIIDSFIREQDSRIEVPVVIANGKAKDALNAKIKQENTSGLYLSNTIKDIARNTKYASVRVLDIAQKLLMPGCATVIPMMRLEGSEEEKEILIDAIAILKDGVMVGEVHRKEILPVVSAIGPVKGFDFEVKSNDGIVVFKMENVKPKRSVRVDKNNQVMADIKLEGILILNEIYGFTNYETVELMNELEKLANQHLENECKKMFEKMQSTNADVYNLINEIYRKHYNKWKYLVQDWDNIFPTIQSTIKSNVKIKQTGDILQSIAIEQMLNEKKLQEQLENNHG